MITKWEFATGVELLRVVPSQGGTPAGVLARGGAMATEADVSGEWRVYKTDGWLWPYTVAGPDGEFETCTQTEWGARRAIRRRKAREWWECPVVYREEA